MACTCTTASVGGSLPLSPRNTALNPSIFSSASHVSKADHFSSPSSIALRNLGTYLPSRSTSSNSIPLFLLQSSSDISILISIAPHMILIISLISAPATISTLYRTTLPLPLILALITASSAINLKPFRITLSPSYPRTT